LRDERQDAPAFLVQPHANGCAVWQGDKELALVHGVVNMLSYPARGVKADTRP
jgi:hypothetical protein